MRLDKDDVVNIIKKACEHKFDDKIEKEEKKLSILIGNLIEQECEIGWERFSKHIQVSCVVVLQFKEEFNYATSNNYVGCRNTLELKVKRHPYYGTPSQFFNYKYKNAGTTDRILSDKNIKNVDVVFNLLKEKGEMFKTLHVLLSGEKSTVAIKNLVPELEKYFPEESRKDLPEDMPAIEKARMFFK